MFPHYTNTIFPLVLRLIIEGGGFLLLHVTQHECTQRDRKNIYSAAGTQSRTWRVRGSFLLVICYGGRGNLNGGALPRGSVLQMYVRARGDKTLPQSCQQRALRGRAPTSSPTGPGALQLRLQPGVWEA